MREAVNRSLVQNPTPRQACKQSPAAAVAESRSGHQNPNATARSTPHSVKHAWSEQLIAVEEFVAVQQAETGIDPGGGNRGIQ